jgi:hypothetical protein
MGFAEDILKLRKRVADAAARGLVTGESKDFLEATLIQVMNDAEKNRQNCLTQSENLRRQAAVMDGQAGAFASVSSIVWSVLNGFVVASERAEEEEKARQAELETNKEDLAQAAALEEEEEENKKRSRKK